MSTRERVTACANCGRRRKASDLDDRAWCADCRAVVVKRATLSGRIIAALVLLAFTWWISSGHVDPRFLALWMVGMLAVYYLVYKVVQRVAFEMIRSRGVPPPEG